MCPQVYRNEVLIESSPSKRCNVYLTNVSSVAQRLPRGTPIGNLENVHESDITPWDQNEPLSVSETTPTIPEAELSKLRTSAPKLTKEKNKIFCNNLIYNICLHI